MKRQRLGENTGGITQVTGVEFILFAPFITVVIWNHSSYRNGIHFVCAIYNGCNVVLSIEISYDKMKE